MMRHSSQKCLKLPQQLLNEIDHHGHGLQQPRSKRVQSGSRKERRRAARIEKPSRKIKSRHGTLRGDPSVKLDLQENGDSNGVRGKLEAVHNLAVTTPALSSKNPLKPKLTSEKGTQELHSVRRLFESSTSKSSIQRLPKGVRDRFADDDAEIKALERALGLKGKRRLPSSFEEDGLDDILESLYELQKDEGRNPKKRKESTHEIWQLGRRRSAECTETSSTQDANAAKEISNGGQTILDNCLEESYSEPDREIPSERSVSGRTRENPYAPPHAPEEHIAPIKYIPPALRPSSGKDQERLQRVQRQTQGLLNRLTEANLPRIVGNIRLLYQENARQDISITLIDLLFSLLSDPKPLQDTFIALHGGFVAAICKVTGADFGAQVIQRFVQELDDLSLRQRHGANVGKRLSNLVKLLTQLYNFHVISSGLMYDFIRIFITDLSEMNTELLLETLKSSGQQLRRDDPSSLKDVAALLNGAVTKSGANEISVRTKFMIETINSLKDNRTKAGNVASNIKSEHAVRMKQTLRSLNVGSVKASEPLRVQLKDIRHSEKRGRWWLVGANHCDEEIGSRMMDFSLTADTTSDRDIAETGDDTTNMLHLAKEQRMNTDIRQSIFVTIMSATDYKDARVCLLKLPLRKSQEFEIPRVLIHCAGAEKTYNPYYTLLSGLLCAERKLRMAFHFSLRDLLKRMNEGLHGSADSSDSDKSEVEISQGLGMRAAVNLAKLYGTLIAEGGLSLSVLKNFNLRCMQPKAKTFVELLLITVIVQSQQRQNGGRSEQALADTFHKLKDTPEVIRGVRMFMKRVVARTDVAGSQQHTAMVKWGCKVADDVLSTISLKGAVDEAS